MQGKTVFAHYLATFNQEQQLIGDAIKLDPPAKIDMQVVGSQFGFQLTMPRDIAIVLDNPNIVGIALMNERKQFLTGFSIPGDPEMRQKGEEFIVTSRYIIIAPRNKPS